MSISRQIYNKYIFSLSSSYQLLYNNYNIKLIMYNIKFWAVKPNNYHALFGKLIFNKSQVCLFSGNSNRKDKIKKKIKL